jgi:hypothetical protein
MQHMYLNHFRILVASTDVIAWNPENDETIYLKHKFKTWYRETAALPLMNFDRECGKGRQGVYYLSKDSKIIQLSIEHGKLVERNVLSKIQSMAIFRDDQAAVLSQDSHLSLIHLPTKAVHYACILPTLKDFSYRTVSIGHLRCTIAIAESSSKSTKQTTPSILSLLDSRLNFISSTNLSIRSRESRPPLIKTI